MNAYELIAEQLEAEHEQKMNNTTPYVSADVQVTLFELEDYTLKVEPAGRNYKYTLLKEEQVVDAQTSDKMPGDCNKDTKFVIRFKKQLMGNVTIPGLGSKYSESQISDVLMKQMRELQSQLEEYERTREERIKQAIEEKDKKRVLEVKKNYNELVRLLHKSDKSIIEYIQLCITYLISGENKNVLIGLLCHLSTYFKRGALWFIAVGKTGEGKSTIEQASIRLLPDDAYMNGNISEAALYRKALDNGRRFLDGKIMRFGDMGGETDFKKKEDILDTYKELTTEGYKELELTSDTINSETGERGTNKYTIEGYCSVSFATIHTEDIDEQYTNRGRLIEPEASNEDVGRFRLYNKGKYAKQVEGIIEYNINLLLHDYIEYIKLEYGAVQVFNPYLECLHKWLNRDEYFKRSIGQYEKLVETVTLLNYPNREVVHNSDGDCFVMSTMEDNALITQLFQPSFGLSPIAIKVFNKLLDWFFKCKKDDKKSLGMITVDCDTNDDYEESVERELSDYMNSSINLKKDCVSIFTVSTVKHKANKVSDLKGIDVGGVLHNLTQKGYITTTDVKMKGSNKNIYKLNFFEYIHDQDIEFLDEDVESYCEQIVPLTYGDIRYTLPGDSVKMKNMFDNEKLRKSFIGDLGASQWF